MIKRRRNKFDYVKAIGQIALNWNLLEVVYHEVFGHYLKLDQPTLAAILNAMGSIQKAELLEFLATTKEEPNARSHLLHLGKTMVIVGENRNIVEHGLPANLVAVSGKVEFFGEYDGTIYKRNRTGKVVPFKATKTDLRRVLSDIARTHLYIHNIIGPQQWDAKSRRIRYASLDKPPLPHKIIPRPLGSVPKAS